MRKPWFLDLDIPRFRALHLGLLFVGCLAAKPLKEPAAQYGQFVMSTRTKEKIEQAIADYKNGQLV
ncbi:MAG: hypothetical protein HOO93_09460 [Methyloglobulus sp.]|nr:hypothetical protein [Methyloglobulus sp.]